MEGLSKRESKVVNIAPGPQCVGRVKAKPALQQVRDGGVVVKERIGESDLRALPTRPRHSRSNHASLEAGTSRALRHRCTGEEDVSSRGTVHRGTETNGVSAGVSCDPERMVVANPLVFREEPRM